VKTNRNVTWQPGQVTPEDRARLLRQTPRTVWLTGLPGSGKTTLAFALEKHLIKSGHTCFVLDGDNVRHGLNRDLSFSPDDRAENIRRVAEVAKLMNEAGVIVITAFISPLQIYRTMAREIIGAGRFLEIYLDTPIEVCEARDPKGLYKKARAGEIAEFTGVTSPYEPPKEPVLALNTESLSIEDALARIHAVISFE
jgi:adenylyl-sulfate kinase